MSRIRTPARKSATGESAAIFGQIKQASAPFPIVTPPSDADYTDAQWVDISLAIAVNTFTHVFNRIDSTLIDLPAFA